MQPNLSILTFTSVVLLSKFCLLFGLSRNTFSLRDLSAAASSRNKSHSSCHGMATKVTAMHGDKKKSAVSSIEIAPLISLPAALWNQPLDLDCQQRERDAQKETGKRVVKALQTSGFLMIESDIMPPELQQSALQDATNWLTTTEKPVKVDSDTELDPLSMVTVHPTDPKSYVMLEAKHIDPTQTTTTHLEPYLSSALRQYWQACEALKKCVLRAIAVGLELEHPEDLAQWHTQGQHSAMRLLRYPPTLPNTGNRCKAHSDYGSVTLLSTDGVSGLEIFLNGTWWPVPHKRGTVVVNIGSLLSEWTTMTSVTNPQQQKSSISPLLATLHRVAGPASEQSGSDPKVLQAAMSQGRTSIAFFADPDNDTPLSQKGTSIEDYIQYRSGGAGKNRSGIAFTESEQGIAEGKEAS